MQRGTRPKAATAAGEACLAACLAAVSAPSPEVYPPLEGGQASPRLFRLRRCRCRGKACLAPTVGEVALREGEGEGLSSSPATQQKKAIPWARFRGGCVRRRAVWRRFPIAAGNSGRHRMPALHAKTSAPYPEIGLCHRRTRIGHATNRRRSAPVAGSRGATAARPPDYTTSIVDGGLGAML